jgi:multiple sugar transport system substrate-binding protein
LALQGIVPAALAAAPKSPTGNACATEKAYAQAARRMPQPHFPPYTKHVTITWWSWVPNDAIAVAMFECVYPSIHVNYVDVGSGPTEYTKLLTALKAGSGAPDLVQIEYQYLPEFISLGGLRSMTPYGGFNYLAFFPEWVRQQVTRGRAVYAIPEDIGPIELYYQAPLLAKLHVAPPKTWAQFKTDALRFLHLYPHKYFSYFGQNDGGWFLSLLWSAGVQPFTINGNTWVVDFTSPQALRVALFWQSLIRAGAVQPIADFSVQWDHNLQAGDYATFVGAAWSANYSELLPQAGWHAANLPQWSTHEFVSGNWGGSTNAVTIQSQHPRAATLLAAWLNTSRAGVYLDAIYPPQPGRGIWPANQGALDVPSVTRPKISLSGQSLAPIAEFSAEHVNTGFHFPPFISYVYSTMSVQMTLAATGKESWASALNTIQQKTVAYANANGFHAVAG